MIRWVSVLLFQIGSAVGAEGLQAMSRPCKYPGVRLTTEEIAEEQIKAQVKQTQLTNQLDGNDATNGIQSKSGEKSEHMQSPWTLHIGPWANTFAAAERTAENEESRAPVPSPQD